MEILSALSSYLPHPLAARLLNTPDRPLFGWSERTDAVVIFADMARFTPLAEALGQHGPQGTEELTHILNDTFTPLIERAHRWGGTVGKFAGDAMVILFTGSNGPARASACALTLRQTITHKASFQTCAGTFDVQMKFGLAAGTVLQTVVGTTRWAEFVFAGRPVDNAASAEHHASPGNIVLHPTLLARLSPDEVDTSPIGEGYALLQGLRMGVPPAPLPPLPATPDETLASQALRPFLPLPIYERLLAGSAAFVNEHRRVTVLFVGFEGINYAIPEAPEWLEQYIDRAVEITNRLGGTIRQVEMGDKGSKMILLFGAPIAHENDEKRALLCALALQELSAEFDFITTQRIGINTGQAFVGNVGSPRRQEYTVIGDAMNLAARLMQAATPGQVLVGEITRQATPRAFAWHPLAPLRVKGKTETVVVYELTGRLTTRPLRLQEPRYALPMVGRQDELALVGDLLERVKETGQGHTVGLTAEAGMGKSRLAAEIIGRALALGFHGFGGNGLSHGTTTPYLAWRPLLRGLLDLEEGQPRAQQVETAHQRLAAVHPDLPARLPLLGDALGLDIPDNDLTASFDANLRRQSFFALVADLIRHQACPEPLGSFGGVYPEPFAFAQDELRRRAQDKLARDKLRRRAATAPLLLVLEDAHWLDDLSRDLARTVARAIPHLPVLFLTIYRPPEIERQPPLWSPPPENFTTIHLGPFSAEESAELIRLKLADRTLPSTFVEQIQQRAQGNPFFVDEFINLIQDREINLDDPEALADLEVPDSLQTLIVSRLDQLRESEKMTLRVASVIGRLFRAHWLLAIYPGKLREELLRRHLDHLDGLELVLLDKPDPELEYLFKHAITQEVVYGTLTFANRRLLHQRVAEYIELAYSGDPRAWYGILAYHYQRAGQPEEEFIYVRLAAQEAARQYASKQAAALYSRAIELLEEHELGTPQETFDLRTSRFEQHTILGEHKRLPEDAEALAALAESLDPPHQVQAWIKRGITVERTGHPAEAIPCYEAAADLARQVGDRRGLIDALRHRGYVYFGTGDYEQGKAMLLQVIEEAGEEGWRQEAGACQVLGWIVYDEGDYEQTEHYWQRSLELMQAHGYKPGESLVLSNLGALYATLNYFRKGIEYAERGLALATQIGYKTGELEGWIRLGEFWMTAGQHERAWECYERTLEVSDRLLGNVWGQAYTRSRMAEVILETNGDLEQAAALNRRALEIARPTGGKELLGWLLHTLGRVLMRRGDVEGAQETLEESASLRRELKQLDPLLATLADLGELLLQQGDLAAARACADEMVPLLLPAEGKGREYPPAGLSCYRILKATGEEQQARDLLRDAHETLLRYADRVETEELRRSFLERTSVNREIVAAYRAAFGGDDT